MDVRKLLAEAVGTFILVTIGSLTIVTSVATNAPLLAVVPFGFGLGLLAAIRVTGHVSGGHYNPAVTLGALLDGRIDLVSAIGYGVAQVVGAILASLTILVISGSQQAVLGTRSIPGANVSDLQAFTTEVVLTAVFLAVILTVTKRARDAASFVIALVLVVLHMACIPISGAGLNPARSLGPALVGGDLGAIWIYWTAPFIGAALGWAVFKLMDDGTTD